MQINNTNNVNFGKLYCAPCCVKLKNLWGLRKLGREFDVAIVHRDFNVFKFAPPNFGTKIAIHKRDTRFGDSVDFHIGDYFRVTSFIKDGVNDIKFYPDLVSSRYKDFYNAAIESCDYVAAKAYEAAGLYERKAPGSLLRVSTHYEV